ncbi:MAG: hypothetical protein ACRC1H_05370, partial [Caldilineaceae bacterium]
MSSDSLPPSGQSTPADSTPVDTARLSGTQGLAPVRDGARAQADGPGSTFTERYDQAWLGSVLRPLLIVTLVICVNVVLVAFIDRFEPALPSLYTGGLVLLASVAAVVGALSTTVLAQPALRLSRTSALRLAEL